MARLPQTDPRLEPGGEADVRPSVATPGAGLPVWVIIGAFALLALLLFGILDARRRAASAPPIRAQGGDDVDAAAQPTPPLFIPPAPVPAQVPTPTPIATPTVAPTPKPLPYIPPPPPRIIYVPQPAPAAPPPPPQPRTSNAPVVILDEGVSSAPPAGPAGGAASASAEGGSVRASVMHNRATTVSQGTLIPAVLESALDSTRAGPVRALVTRDVRGFDGTRVLIQRGSRLFGDYRSDLQPGQHRALVTWTRLVRPDGATIALASPASDPLGRAGIHGQVNSHFLERFGSAFLQSALQIGVNVASARLGNTSSPVILALPATSQTLTQPLAQNNQVQPTLKVQQGTAIDVFVAHDLDFTAVEAAR
jgi:type IV secretion system protein VirB10